MPARGIIESFEDFRGENGTLDADAGVIHARYFPGTKRYFWMRLLGFSVRVYSISPFANNSLMARLIAPDTRS